MIKMTRNLFLLAAALSTSWACSAENKPVDIGDARTGERLQDYAAVWEGYAEAYTFADGSDKVKISLDSLGNGTLEIGNGPALPIATDPSLRYPTNAELNWPAQYAKLFPGFAYTVDTATVESARIRFTLNPWQVAHDWCALQTQTYDSHYAVGSGGAGSSDISNVFPSGGAPPGFAVGPDSSGYGLSQYRCVPFERIPSNPDKFDMCWNGLCSCDEQSCTNYAPPAGAMATRGQLDAALDNGGNSLVGTLKVGNGGQISMTVRLKRVHNN
jgi:hypothetical protein